MEERTPVQWVTITEDNAGQRIDNFLMAQFRHIPKGRIYRMIRSGEVRVNRSRVRNHDRLSIGDEVRLPPVTLPKAEKITIKPNDLTTIHQAILFENEHLLLLDKPSGYAVHAGSGNEYGIIEIVRERQPDHTFFELVQRLDRETSGLLLIAKSRASHQALQQTPLKRCYQLLVNGRWPSNMESVNLPLDTANRQANERYVIPSPQGKPALTHFTILETFPRTTLLEAELVTGRTHQIRVHTQSAGHPIIGDTRYGDSKINADATAAGLSRLFLHASHLSFTLFDQPYQFDSPLPPPLRHFLKSV